MTSSTHALRSNFYNGGEIEVSNNAVLQIPEGFQNTDGGSFYGKLTLSARTKGSAGARARGKSERVSEVRGCEVGVARSVLVATDVECNFPFAAHQRL